MFVINIYCEWWLFESRAFRVCCDVAILRVELLLALLRVIKYYIYTLEKESAWRVEPVFAIRCFCLQAMRGAEWRGSGRFKVIGPVG